MSGAAVIGSYTRKLSREDVETGSIFITKDRWRMFPPPLEEFAVVVAGREFRTCIVAEDCVCVPPPHQHYHLEAGHFRDLLDFTRGRTVAVQREADDRYRVEMAGGT
jgi:hypothetical protein